MALKIRTADGKPFYRCGIKFTGDAIIVGNKTLNKLYGSPEPSKNNPTTVKDVLLAERMLVCGPAKDVGADQEPGNSDAKGQSKGK